ncbi:hypothetical protein Tco_1314258 [Tanacetum coccineum]
MRQRRWLELLSDYDCDIRYHPGKQRSGDATGRTRTIEPLRGSSLVMTIGLDLPKRILEDSDRSPENRRENIAPYDRTLSWSKMPDHQCAGESWEVKLTSVPESLNQENNGKKIINQAKDASGPRTDNRATPYRNESRWSSRVLKLETELCSRYHPGKRVVTIRHALEGIHVDDTSSQCLSEEPLKIMVKAMIKRLIAEPQIPLVKGSLEL